MAKKSTKSLANQYTPATDSELDALLAKIGQAEARIATKAALCDESKAALDEELAQDTAIDSEYAKQARKAAAAYIEANRARLTPKGKKTITLKSGVIEYRSGRLSITVKGVDSVIAGLEELGLSHFVTVKKTVNKDALLDLVRAGGFDALPDVAGLILKQGAETLDIKPNATIEDIGQ